MDGTLIVEVYEYLDTLPAFEYIPCSLSTCLKGKNASLKEIIQRGFDDLPKKIQDTEKRHEILQKLEDADIGKIDVVYHPRKNGKEPYIELTNVVPVNLTYSDARRRIKQNKDNIILKGRYKLSDEGNEVTMLKDAQRLTLIYSNTPEGEEQETTDEGEIQQEIFLNITYLQD